MRWTVHVGSRHPRLVFERLHRAGRTGVRVLIVDDSACFRRVACELVASRGYAIAGEADTAASATELVGPLLADAVLLDVHLPDLSGFETARRITANHPGVAVLLTSADADPSFCALAESSGARGFVPKAHLARVNLGQFWPAPVPGAGQPPTDGLTFCRLTPGWAG